MDNITILIILFFTFFCYCVFVFREIKLLREIELRNFTLYVKQKHRVVVSLTTSPKRINKIYKVIENLENQTVKPDLYFINLPFVFKRDNSRFSEIPSFLINDKIKLNFCEDLGPATKIVPTCKSNHIRDSDIIFSVDDDIYYPPGLLELYIKYHVLYPSVVISGTSLFPKLNGKSFGALKECELLEGFSCVLYKKKFLEDIPLGLFDKKSVPIYHYLSDDLVLSNFLVMKGIGILCFTVNNPIIKKIRPLDYGLQEDALHKGAGGLTVSCNKGEACNSVNYIETIKYLRKRNSYYLQTLETDVKRV